MLGWPRNVYHRIFAIASGMTRLAMAHITIIVSLIPVGSVKCPGSPWCSLLSSGHWLSGVPVGATTEWSQMTVTSSSAGTGSALQTSRPDDDADRGTKHNPLVTATGQVLSSSSGSRSGHCSNGVSPRSSSHSCSPAVEVAFLPAAMAVVPISSFCLAAATALSAFIALSTRVWRLAICAQLRPPGRHHRGGGGSYTVPVTVSRLSCGSRFTVCEASSLVSFSSAKASGMGDQPEIPPLVGRHHASAGQ